MSAGPMSAGPMSAGPMSVIIGTGSQLPVASQKVLAGQALSSGLWKQLPSTQRPVRQSPAAAHSASPLQSGSGQASGFSGVQLGGTQRPETHWVASIGSPMPGQVIASSSHNAVITAVTVSFRTSRSSGAWVVRTRPSARSATSIRYVPSGRPEKLATRMPVR